MKKNNVIALLVSGFLGLATASAFAGTAGEHGGTVNLQQNVQQKASNKLNTTPNAVVQNKGQQVNTAGERANNTNSGNIRINAAGSTTSGSSTK
jgi:hypothetical protein